MTNSTVFGIPYLASQQASPEIAHNFALYMIEAMLRGVKAIQNAPPGGPADGDTYIVGTAGSGAWAGKNNCVAIYASNAWRFVPGFNTLGAQIAMGAAQEGMTLFNQAVNRPYTWTGAAWTPGPLVDGESIETVATIHPLLINGDGQIWQRDSLTAAVVADGAFFTDRWIGLTQTANVSAARQALSGEPGQIVCTRLTQTQAVAQRIGMAQIIENGDMSNLRGSIITMGARVRPSAAMTLRYAILDWTGTSNTMPRDVVNDWTSATYTTGNFFKNTAGLSVVAVGSLALAANVFTDLTPLSGTYNANGTNCMIMFWSEGTLAQNVTLDFGLCRANRGSVLVPFMQEKFQDVLRACQWYFQKSFSDFQPPIQNLGAGAGEYTISSPVAGAVAITGWFIPWRVPVRQNSGVTGVVLFNPAAANAQARDISAGADCSGTVVSTTNRSGFIVSLTGAAGTVAGGRIGIHWTMDAEVGT